MVCGRWVGSSLVLPSPLCQLLLHDWAPQEHDMHTEQVLHSCHFLVCQSSDCCLALERRVTQADVEEAAKQANAHEFITALPQGYDTPVRV